MSDALDQKINSLEVRFEKHAASMENKMTEMVRLMTAVATLQERGTRHEDNILEMRKFLDNIQVSIKDSVERLHTRMDNSDRDAAQRHIQWKGEIDKTRAEAENIVWREKAAIMDVLTKVSDSHNTLESLTHSYINKIKGIWLAGAIGLLVIQFIGGYVINMIREDYKSNQAVIREISDRVSENEKTTLQIWQTIRQGADRK